MRGIFTLIIFFIILESIGFLDTILRLVEHNYARDFFFALGSIIVALSLRQYYSIEARERDILKIIAIAFSLGSFAILILWKMDVRQLAAIFELCTIICLIFALKQTSIELKKF